MDRPPAHLGIRTTAYVVWGSLLLGVVAFAAAAAVAGPGMRRGGVQAPEVIAGAALALAAAGALASRLLPPRLRRPADRDPDAFAMSRNIVAAGLCEGPALFGLVAWMLTDSPWAVVATAIAIAGLVACFPGDARWRWLAADAPARPGPGGPSRMVR
jgi:hypothetical protein